MRRAETLQCIMGENLKVLAMLTNKTFYIDFFGNPNKGNNGTR